ncbi:hypothetical protein HYPSUDRAFT_1097662, partial [Hypholoma sublateritium FD-334 SS-4]
YILAFGVYQDYYTRIFLSQTTPSNISWIGSFQLFVQYAPGIVIGRVFDAGYFHHMMIAGSILQVVSMIMLSLAHQGRYYQVFLAQAVGMGLGQSMLLLPSLAIIGQHFQRRRALATGLATSGASVGGLVWTTLLNHLNKHISFANSIRVTAAVTAVLLIAANLMMKTKLFKAPAVVRPSFMIIFRDSPYLVSIASSFYLQLYAVNLGIKTSLALYTVTILNAGGILGRLVPNFLADHFGPYNMLIICLLICSILAFAMLAISNFGGLIIFSLLYGFWSGSCKLTSYPLLRFPVNDRQRTRIGFAFSVVGISLLVGTPIEGALLHESGGLYLWYKPILFCAVSQLLHPLYTTLLISSSSKVMIMCGTVGMAASRMHFASQGRGGAYGWRI